MCPQYGRDTFSWPKKKGRKVGSEGEAHPTTTLSLALSPLAVLPPPPPPPTGLRRRWRRCKSLGEGKGGSLRFPGAAECKKGREKEGGRGSRVESNGAGGRKGGGGRVGIIFQNVMHTRSRGRPSSSICAAEWNPGRGGARAAVSERMGRLLILSPPLCTVRPRRDFSRPSPPFWGGRETRRIYFRGYAQKYKK